MLKGILSEIKDTRQRAQVRHSLHEEIIAKILAAATGKCGCWGEIEDFCIRIEFLMLFPGVMTAG